MPSIRKLLPTIVVTQIFVAMGVTGCLSFVSAKQEIEALIDKIIVQGSKLIEDRVREYLATPHFFQAMNSVAIQNGNLNVDNFESLERYFWRQVQVGTNRKNTTSDIAIDEQGIEYIFYGNRQGDFLGVQQIENGKSLMRIRTQQSAPERIFYELDSQGKRSPEIKRDEYDPVTRPWYKEAQKNKKLSWSPIYASASDGSLGINSILPVYDNRGSLKGVLAIEISLERISEFLSGLKTGPNGKAFIVETSGKLVGTSINESLSISTFEVPKQIYATESSDPMIKAIAQKLFEEDRILQKSINPKPFYLQVQGERQIIKVTYLEALELDWLIVVVIPEADFLDQIYANLKSTIGSAFAALVSAVVICLITSRWIFRPITLLNKAANQIQAENFQPETLVGLLKRQDELGQLARVFQEMGVKIYNREQGMKEQMDRLRLEQEKAREATMQATIDQKAYLQDLLTASKKLHSKTGEDRQLPLQDLLRKVKYFENFSQADIQGFIDIGYQKIIPEKEYVCREDEPGGAFYMILTGNVEIHVEKINKFLTNLSDGDFFGELSLLLGIPRTATVRTTTDTILFVVERDGLQGLLQNNQELADQIAIELHEHKAELDERQEMLKSLGLIDEEDNSFNENPLSWIRKRITTLFGV